jgi:hypothetical protein
MRDVPVSLQIPTATPKEFKAKVTVLAVDYRKDLSLIEVAYGPLDFVAPVARDIWKTKSGHYLSVGYDGMEFPPKQEKATFVGETVSGKVLTKESPWPGRSGGALLDADTGELVGVVSMYSRFPGMPGGYYIGLDDIRSFLREAGRRPETFAHNLPQREGIAVTKERSVPQYRRVEITEERSFPQYRNIGVREERSFAPQVRSNHCSGGR